MKSIFTTKLRSIKKILHEQKLDGVIISCSINRYWLTNLSTSAGIILVGRDKTYYLTDNRYRDYLIQNNIVIDETIIVERSESSYYQKINLIAKHNQWKQIGFEGNVLTFNAYQLLAKCVTRIKLVNVNISNLRMNKTPEEISFIKQGADILKRAFDHICKWIKPGVSETDVKTELEQFLMQNGTNELSFGSIVAFGQNTAIVHHNSVSTKILQKNDIVMMDFGCKINGYCCDMTRTFFIGKPETKLKEIYNVVLEANKIGIKSIKAGKTGFAVDATVREHIEKAGYGEYFLHGTGHGLGLLIHEKPFVSTVSEDKLVTNSVVTIEPGIYISGLGGVRIEDDVHVSSKGPIVLTSANKELVIA